MPMAMGPPGFETAGVLGAATFAALIANNLMKVPFFLGIATELPMTNKTYDPVRCDPISKVPVICHGMEVSQHMHAMFGLRNYKLLADPILFLTPHTLMGCTLLAILSLLLLRRTTLKQAAAPYFGLMTALVVHLWPVRHGIPAQQTSGDPNTLAALGLLSMVALATLGRFRDDDGMLLYAYVISGAILLIPIIVELNVMLWQMGHMLRHGRWAYVEGDRPSPSYGHDLYGRMDAHWAGWLLVFGVTCTSAAVLWDLYSQGSLREAVRKLQAKKE